MAEIVLRYALRDGELISIENVESGLKCNCICPECKKPLIARKGSKREHHFAHISNTNCSGGVETALHLLAKKLLFTFKTIYVPDVDKKGKGRWQKYSAAELECRDYLTFIPDVVLKKENGALGVEILVTHAVDEEKEKKIMDAQLPTLEIDLSDQIESYNEDTVMRAILSGRDTKWIYNPIIAAREKEQHVRDELCDYLYPVCDINKPFYKCPIFKKLISVPTHCDNCSYYSGHVPKDHMSRIKCTYRTRAATAFAAKDIQYIQRDTHGYFMSAELLVNDQWITWVPRYDESELFEEKDRLALVGKKITDFRNLDCDAVIVRNIVDESEWIIEVNRQEGIFKRANYQQNMVLGERVSYDDMENKYCHYYNPGHKECIPDAGEPIWENIIDLYAEQ